jgi:enoyl-CoA hydratase/carnithine racemase
MAENAPLTMKAIKAAVLQSAVLEKDRDVALVTRLVDACFASQDYKEGRAAFLEKRTPVFRGV